MITQVQTGFWDAIKQYPETWASTTAYSVGDFVKPSSYNNHTYLVSVAGTTASSEPSWGTTNGDSVTDGTVTFEVCDAKCYNTLAPQNAEVPYVCFGLLTENQKGDFEDFEAIEDLTFWINCFSDRSIADVSEIADEVMDTLDGATITASGFTSMKCVREYTAQPMYDDTNRVFQLYFRYRVWLDKS